MSISKFDCRHDFQNAQVSNRFLKSLYRHAAISATTANEMAIEDGNKSPWNFNQLSTILFK